MLRESRNLDEKSPTGVCIIGSGPAGLTIADQLSRSGIDVLVLERGRRRVDRQASENSQLDSVGAELGPDWRIRRFGLGGSGWLWAGTAIELNPAVLAARPWISGSGWPITPREMRAYYDKARTLLNVTPVWDKGHLELPTGKLMVQPIATSPKRFGGRRAASDFPVYLEAVLKRLVPDRSGSSIDHAEVMTPVGLRRIRAKCFVLAAGGIENPRLMLISEIGNGLVGRFFADHLSATVPISIPPTKSPPPAFVKLHPTRPPAALLALSNGTCREMRLPAAAAYFEPYRRPDLWQSDGVEAWRSLAWALRYRESPLSPMTTTARALAHPLGLVRSLRERSRERTPVAAHVILEMAPNPDSRVTLSERSDQHGMPLARIDLAWTGRELKALTVMLKQLAEMADLQNWGPVALPSRLGWPESVTGSAHHMGATRMHVSPTAGVVDPNCRVHGLDNLFVAGSSLFPTYGHANPTLSIVALAVRLADHLRSLTR